MNPNVAELIKNKEGQELEFKSGTDGLPRSVWETYSAFANTVGGIMIIGVKETSKENIAVGVKNPQKMLSDIWNILNDPNKVSSNLLSDNDVTVETVGEKEVVVMRVPRADRHERPVFINNNPVTGTYKRNNEGDYHCTGSQLKAMFRDASDDVPDRGTIDGGSVDWFNRDTVRKYVNAYNQQSGSMGNGFSVEEILVMCGAAENTGDGLKPTKAGLLMFGQEYFIVREFPNYFLDYRKYPHEDDADWSDRFTSQTNVRAGNVYEFYRHVAEELSGRLPVPMETDEWFRITETPVHKAVREVLINALVHSDYSETQGVVIEIRGGRMLISNPGSFRIPPKTAEQGGVSDPRNPTLFRMFGMIGLIERAGSGIYRSFRIFRECGLKEPEIIETFEPPRVTVSFSVNGNAAKASSDLTEPVLGMIKADGNISMREMSQRLGIGIGKLNSVLNILKDGGTIERVGGRKGGKWIVK